MRPKSHLPLLRYLPFLLLPGLGTADDVDFNRDVRPILAAHCYKCHGPDEQTREAGLRLDQFEPATADLGGYAAVVPGDSEASELVLRVASEDPDMRMPPGADDGLTPAQIDTLRRWIDGGAAYARHWAFIPPQRPDVPPAVEAFTAPADHPIDRFVQARLAQQTSLQPSPPADRYALVRRLYLDLTGLPPSPAEADRFVNDAHPDAVPRLVDRLLASPAFAEHTAQTWLDLARYADTNGYEKDRPRTIWPYRDWVLQAISADMPFDRFSIEQLAGDMLPGATSAQRIATGFHRNTMLNEEGGIDPQEYRFHAVVDRVATTGTVWMGLTIGCAQCHTHKYDPITHTDYYALMALLNNADEPDVVVEAPDVRERQQQIDAEVDARERELVRRWLPAQDHAASQSQAALVGPLEYRPTVALAFRRWLEKQRQEAVHWRPLTPVELESTLPRLQVLEDSSVLASGDVTKRDVYRLRFPLDGSISALRLEVLPHASLPAGGPGMAFYEGRRGDFFLSELRVRIDGRDVPLHQATHDYGKISVGSGDPAAANVLDGDGSTGWSTSGREGEASQLVVNLQQRIGEQSASEAGEIEIELLFERHFAAALGRFRISATDAKTPVRAASLPVDLVQQLAETKPADQSLSVPQYERLQRHFLRTSPLLSRHYAPVAALAATRPEPVRTLGFRERPADHPRQTHRHHRGEYLQPREPVAGNIPAVFAQLSSDAPRDRLQLARWLVSEENPLVARVMVNRVWRNLFGYGLVRTDGDFGTQSEPPSHPRLLDYLATEWVRHDWSLKWLYRQIVLSATYRQSSHWQGEGDPENRFLARAPRVRLSAEAIRDQFLEVSGRLSRSVGGPSVYPPQPASVTALAYGNSSWKPSSGGDRYRRSLYTFTKRTAPFAAAAVFDAPSRETCTARRQRSNTPLQALTLLNDEMFLELARHLADQHASSSQPLDAVVTQLFREILVRPPTAQERTAMLDFYHRQADHQVPREQILFLLCRALMNTDEAITKP